MANPLVLPARYEVVSDVVGCGDVVAMVANVVWKIDWYFYFYRVLHGDRILIKTNKQNKIQSFRIIYTNSLYQKTNLYQIQNQVWRIEELRDLGKTIML